MSVKDSFEEEFSKWFKEKVKSVLWGVMSIIVLGGCLAAGFLLFFVSAWLFMFCWQLFVLGCLAAIWFCYFLYYNVKNFELKNNILKDKENV
jgi:membrane protein YdbS with pleckstrin-like domain